MYKRWIVTITKEIEKDEKNVEKKKKYLSQEQAQDKYRELSDEKRKQKETMKWINEGICLKKTNKNWEIIRKTILRRKKTCFLYNIKDE